MYKPQLYVMSLIHDPALATVSTVLLVLQETSIVVSILGRYSVLRVTLRNLFDATLLACDETRLVKGSRILRLGHSPMQNLGRLRVHHDLEPISPRAWMLYAACIPLSVLPSTYLAVCASVYSCGLLSWPALMA